MQRIGTDRILILVLMGTPGSGNCTFAANLKLNCRPETRVDIISRDDLTRRWACVKQFRELNEDFLSGNTDRPFSNLDVTGGVVVDESERKEEYCSEYENLLLIIARCNID
ncbi:unnamed protein product [Amoebophrya sp. A120]|nr:unnamed protein product [Amoebophrya sp. A120]|eukprot:GSA120T00020212001.1